MVAVKLFLANNFLNGFLKMFVCKLLKQFVIIVCINSFTTKFLQTASLNGFSKRFVENASLNVLSTILWKVPLKEVPSKGSFERLLEKDSSKHLLNRLILKVFAERVFQRLFQRILKSYWKVSSMASSNHVLWWLRKRRCCASHLFFRPRIFAFKCFPVQLLRV